MAQAMDSETPGERIHTRRRRLGIKLTALARNVGISDAAMSRYERGLRDIPSTVLARIARELQTTPNDLFGFRDTPGYRIRVPQAA